MPAEVPGLNVLDRTLLTASRGSKDNPKKPYVTPGKPDDDTSDSLYPPVPQFGKVGTQYTEAQVFWVAKHGIRHSGMFANGKWDPDERLWTIAAYIKRIGALPPAVKEELQQKPPDAVGSKDSGKS